MQRLSRIKEIYASFLELDPRVRGKIFLIGAVLFTLFFSYPMMRVSTTTLLLAGFGAKGSPYAWCFSVVVLIITVWLFNKAQRVYPIKKIYRATVLITLLVFVIFFVIYKWVTPYGSYLLYVAKEVYIVVLINSVLAFLNTSIDKKTAKLIYGPLGAISSVGGIIGAFSTGFLAKSLGEEYILLGALLFIASTLLTFNLIPGGNDELADTGESSKKVSALSAIQSVKGYISCIICLVVLSQFVINIANYQFNFFLTDYFVDNSSRSEFLGRVYGLINTCSLLIQVFAIPLILKFVPSFLTHLGIVGTYGLAFVVPLVMGGSSLIGAAVTFIIFKGLDYSIFSAAKELLYFSLSDQQKYGAKYLVDMVFYRFSKGLISVVLIVIPAGYVNLLMGLSLALWIAVLFPLFKNYKKLQLKKDNQDILEKRNEPTTT